MSEKAEYKPICPHEQCTGCMACINACSHQAITIQEDCMGFRYPMIDGGKCRECGLCFSVCPELRPRKLADPAECYAAKVSDKSMLMAAASGGVCSALALAAVRRDDVVAGCTGEDMADVNHTIIRDEAELHRLSGSKYVQSRISPTLLRDIRRIIAVEKKNVLFIGTPCQNAGVRNFIGEANGAGLTTVELVCHGVPSQLMLNQTAAHYGRPASTLRLREKCTGKDGRTAVRYGWITDDFYVPEWKDPYMAAFFKTISMRDGCYRCRYAAPKRQSDLTVFDFWGLGSDCAIDRSDGINAVFVNTERGRRAFDGIRDMIAFEERSVSEALKGNGQLNHPTPMNPQREEFRQLCATRGFVAASEATALKQMHKSLLKRVKSKITRIIKKLKK